MKACLVILVAIVCGVRSHSWLACTDYMEKNGADWDPEKCRGFPRSASRYAQKNNFGQDTGYDFRPKADGKGCQTAYSDGGYSAEYPKAVYYPGQQVILAHPMKNHGADPGCTNAHIPDNGNAIYRGRVNQDRDKSFAHYKQRLVAQLGVSKTGSSGGDLSKYPKPGYQNAPHFCQNTDRSMGTYSFNVPENLAEGEYTFMWRWSFNSKEDLYSTCFDVIITKDKKERDETLMERGAGLYIACGGTVSDETPGGEVGCDDIVAPPPPPGGVIPGGVNPGNPQPPPPPRPTLPPNSEQVPIQAFQLVGEISLPPTGKGIFRRHVSVHFDCAVDVNFWNARLVVSHNHSDRKKRHSAIHYELIQETAEQLKSEKIFYKAGFEQPCDVTATPPMVKLKRDEYTFIVDHFA